MGLRMVSTALVLLSLAVGVPAARWWDRSTIGHQDVDDLITKVPGLRGELRSKHYGGYITVNEDHGRNLYYYFVESERDPINDPVRFVYEHGPFNFNLRGADNEQYELTHNPNAWTTVASVLYLDSPAGVGMSYSNHPEDYVTNDTRTAADANIFLRGFFAKYPQFLDNDFYISGESYAGIYVPNLARAVVHGNKAGEEPKINLKGYLVGNGCTDPEFDGNAFPLFAMGKSLISASLYNDIQSACTPSFWGASENSANCADLLNEMQEQLADLNLYDILKDCYHGSGATAQRRSALRAVRSRHREWPVTGVVRPGAKVLNWQHLLGDDEGAPPCTDTRVANLWLNDPEVRKAIHAASLEDIGRWYLCTGKIDYTHDIPTMIPIHRELIEKHGLRALVYSGDHDLCVPHTGSEAWTRSLGYKVTDPWQPWLVPDDGDGRVDQVGGYVVEYGNLTYATIKGAGHMVPQTNPREGFAFFSRFIAGKQLTDVVEDAIQAQ